LRGLWRDLQEQIQLSQGKKPAFKQKLVHILRNIPCEIAKIDNFSTLYLRSYHIGTGYSAFDYKVRLKNSWKIVLSVLFVREDTENVSVSLSRDLLL